jgi:predicted DNA-binding protein (MmcQ/YjbR family)
MNKKHWVTVLMDGTIPDKLVRSWVEQSYNLVVAGLTKKQRLALEGME